MLLDIIIISLFWKHKTGQCQKIQNRTIKRVPRVGKAATALTTAHITKSSMV